MAQELVAGGGYGGLIREKPHCAPVAPVPSSSGPPPVAPVPSSSGPPPVAPALVCLRLTLLLIYLADDRLAVWQLCGRKLFSPV